MNRLFFSLLLLVVGLGAQAQTPCWTTIKATTNPTNVTSLTATIDPTLTAKFLWSTGETTETIFPNALGAYCVTATFPHGCTANDCYNYTGGNGGGGSCSATIKATPLNTGGLQLEASTDMVSVDSYVWSTGETTASIVVTQPGVYCVTATDGHCTATACHHWAKPNRMNVIVQYTGSAGVTADVYLIKYDPAQGGILTAIDTVTSTPNGSADFVDVPAGDYLVKAAIVAGTVGYSDNLPTYFNGALLWSQATPVNVQDLIDPTNPIASITINLVSGHNPGGPGFIGGLVLQGANFHEGADDRGEGDPVAGASVLLETIDGQAIASAKSNASGQYSFPNLPYGTYKVSIDIPGIPVVTGIVTIGANAPAANNVNFKVDDNSAVLPTHEVAQSAQMQLWPNPVSFELNLQLPTADNQISLLDARGTTVFQAFVHDADVKIPVQRFPAGMYILTVRSTDGETTTQKIFKN